LLQEGLHEDGCVVRDATKTSLLTMTKRFCGRKNIVVLMSPKGVSKDAH